MALRYVLPIALFACSLTVGCAADMAAPGPIAGSQAYRLGSGDKLKLTVFGDTTITGEYAVDGEGIVSLPAAGNIRAKGMTLTEFRTEVEDRLGKAFVRNPHIAAEVINFRPVYILGDVTTPGEFPYAEHMSVFELAAKAGGFTYRADRHYVFIRHDGEAAEIRYQLSSGTAVEPGDTVRIGQRLF